MRAMRDSLSRKGKGDRKECLKDSKLETERRLCAKKRDDGQIGKKFASQGFEKQTENKLRTSVSSSINFYVMGEVKKKK